MDLDILEERERIWDKIRVRNRDYFLKLFKKYGEGIVYCEVLEQDFVKIHFFRRGTEEYDRLFIRSGWKPEDFLESKKYICFVSNSIPRIREI